MKKIIYSLVFAYISIQSIEASTFVYGDLHTLGNYPMIGGGIRFRDGKHSLDFSGNFSTKEQHASFPLFHLRGIYSTFPGFLGIYIGGGVGLVNEPKKFGMTASVESAVGMQWSHLFMEASSTVPFNDRTQVLPGISVGLGF
ncbi:MAG: hypothetical protein FJZ56_06945 [Chlamydiae bacterium]|nr:hypothetical protein [Chlamydiota bacterium]